MLGVAAITGILWLLLALVGTLSLCTVAKINLIFDAATQGRIPSCSHSMPARRNMFPSTYAYHRFGLGIDKLDARRIDWGRQIQQQHPHRLRVVPLVELSDWQCPRSVLRLWRQYR